MAAFYDYFNEQKYSDAVKNVSVSFLFSCYKSPVVGHKISIIFVLYVRRQTHG